MTPEQMIDLLSLIAARDRRTIGKADVAVWMEDIGDLSFDDARRAVADHFREEPDTWLMAGHVRRRVQAMRAERLGPPGPGLHPTPPPADPDNPRAYLAALRAQQRAIADGRQPRALSAGDSRDAGYDGNPHVQALVDRFKAEQDAARRREREEREAERQALAAYRQAVETLLALPDHGAAALAAARDHLLGDEQAARGFPDLQATPGVMDEHKIHIWAARTVTDGREEDLCRPSVCS